MFLVCVFRSLIFSVSFGWRVYLKAIIKRNFPILIILLAVLIVGSKIDCSFLSSLLSLGICWFADLDMVGSFSIAHLFPSQSLFLLCLQFFFLPLGVGILQVSSEMLAQWMLSFISPSTFKDYFSG